MSFATGLLSEQHPATAFRGAPRSGFGFDPSGPPLAFDFRTPGWPAQHRAVVVEHVAARRKVGLVAVSNHGPRAFP